MFYNSTKAEKKQFLKSFATTETLNELKFKKSKIPEEKIQHFLDNLFIITIKDADLEENINIIKKIVNFNTSLSVNTVNSFFYGKLKDWLEGKKAFYLKGARLDAFLSEITSVSFLKNLSKLSKKIILKTFRFQVINK